MTTHNGRDAFGRLARLGIMCAGLALLAGCAGSGGLRESSGSMGYAPSEAAAPRAAAKAAPASPMRAPSTTAVAVARDASPGGTAAEEKPPSQSAGTQGSGAQVRLRIYSGFLELVVGEVEKARKRIIDTAGQIGGYVESSSAEYVVVRVPAPRFDEVMDTFSDLGEVRARSVESVDVTDSYADLGRRIELATVTRQRLYDLLEKTTDVEERVGILREIRRLTEEIEQLTAALSVMEGQIQLSRITVHLISRIDDSRGSAGIPFPWIAGLRPLYPSSGLAAAAIPVTVPTEYASFESDRRVRLEAADGTRLSIGALPNEPSGDTAFWRDALIFHLKGLYRSSEGVAAGAFAGAVFESKDIEPFHYLVAVAVRGDEILLAEAFFPNGASRTRRLAGILAALEGAKP